MARARRLKGNRTHIKVTRETVEELKKLKRGNENYDSIIRRLIKSYRTVIGF
ncbi:MAG: hypothetical protein QXU69_04545 [Thermofilaceae archaeon]